MNYTIHHIDLSQEINTLHDGAAAQGHYLVFWYQSIPLGESYIDSRNVETEHLQKLIIASANPAIQQYCRLCNITYSPIETIDQLRTICEKFMRCVDPEYYPETSDVSIVICTRNRAASLRNCLLALQRQHTKPLEIIVVDNASTSADTAQVCSEFTNVRYIREERVGLDIARNTGARNAKSSIVAYTDDDTVPDPNWVYRISEGFRKDDVVAMTGLVLAGSLGSEAEVIFEKHWPFNRGFTHKIFDQHFFNDTLPSGPPVWEIGAGANMAFRRNIFDDVGYFDERLDVGAAGCSGDSELWYRILANGFKIVYNPLAVVSHFHRSSMEGLKRQLFSYMKGFTVAILIQYDRFGHRGNLQHLFRVIPLYYLKLIRQGFPKYPRQYQTIFSEMRGILAGMVYYLRHKSTNPGIYSHENF